MRGSLASGTVRPGFRYAPSGLLADAHEPRAGCCTAYGRNDVATSLRHGNSEQSARKAGLENAAARPLPPPRLAGKAVVPGLRQAVVETVLVAGLAKAP